MYYKISDTGLYTIILLYVDDLLITGDDEANINIIQAALKMEFEMTNLGQASQYLGAEFEYHKLGI
jgi:hypothetical protein